ncbi:acyl-CoA dehydrogenase family protein [Pusillimonas sp.]|uniref:acyl-CoA dehydrogenase family protein n=1 Tax=Pusillimonas sp. TaxID=3040095 RepID=UPI0037C4F80E
MLTYHPPIRDIRFVLSELLNAAPRLSALPGFEDVDEALIMEIAEQAGRFSTEVLLPLNAVGDQHGCKYEDGQVSTPPGFADAYRQFVGGGWPSLTCDPKYGGQGLPGTLHTVLYEMLGACNHAWSMYPVLLRGAYECLNAHASEQLKQQYLPNLVSGKWLATMCLTEPHAGSDLGLLRTRATPQADGTVRVTGSKIFISGGQQDLTENIIHLVLGRLPDAPAGSKGISLFLVPKFIPAREGADANNTITCTGIEHKMGIHGSATCRMEFEEATGWLVGEPHRGLAAMFIMMNEARLAVGIQGVATADVAWQSSLAYAQERVQMRAAIRPPSASARKQAADPIIFHPPVQRLLMNQRVYVEGFRMLAYHIAVILDEAERHPDTGQRALKQGQLSLLTPVLKSMATDQAFDGASKALQIFGGHGFMTEMGIEQYVRDTRIALIYEGTNEIQAIDLVVRKIVADKGRQLELLLTELRQMAHGADSEFMSAQRGSLDELVDAITARAKRIIAAADADSNLPHHVAPDMLRLIGHGVLSGLWLQAARAAQTRLEHDTGFYQAKIDTAQYYFSYVLPETASLLLTIDHALEAGDNHPGSRALAEVLPFQADFHADSETTGTASRA